jgi:flagellin FlaB
MALKRMKKFRNDEGAIIGIGTLIVFVALILVAGIASAVIIHIAAKLGEQGEKTGEETLHDVGVGIHVKAVAGMVDIDPANTTYGCIIRLRMLIELLPGAQDLNLNTTMLSVVTENTGNDKSVNLIHWYGPYIAAVSPSGYYFVFEEGNIPAGLDPNDGYNCLPDPAGNPRPWRPYLDQDAILVVEVHLGSGTNAGGAGIDSPMPPASYCTLKFMPAGGGAMGIESFRTPGSYGPLPYVSPPVGERWVELA